MYASLVDFSLSLVVVQQVFASNNNRLRPGGPRTGAEQAQNLPDARNRSERVRFSARLAVHSVWRFPWVGCGPKLFQMVFQIMEHVRDAIFLEREFIAPGCSVSP
uniref:Putative secreted protein n=1 Tax=Anopheles marajoara TaxID=58244 RepID=A0A2M4C8C3_9DIPT